MHFDHVRPQRRRSERVAKSLPIVVRGTDLLGQPFEERTATLNFNLHGCRYASRYHLPKNAWVTLEVPRGSEFENTRARVAWIQRPHSVREFFQISVELEAPQNIWGFEPSPDDWAAAETSSMDAEEPVEASSEPGGETPELNASHTVGEPREQVMDEMDAVSAAAEPMVEGREADEGAADEVSARTETNTAGNDTVAHDPAVSGVTAASDSNEDRNAWISADAFENWKREFEQMQNAAHERLANFQSALLDEIKTEFQQNVTQAKWLIDAVEKSREALHAENKAAAEFADRLAGQRNAAAEAGQSRHADPLPAQFVPEQARTEWRHEIASEMDAARAQWDELLQSSLDNGVRRLAERLSERAGEVLQPLVDGVSGAKEAVGEIQRTLEHELGRAKGSLAEIERSAAQVSSLSGQIDSAASSALDALNRRLELILNAQTEEMGERAERLTNRAAAKAASEIDAASRTTIEDVAAQIESKLNPHYDRITELLRELSAKELQTEESLRLQRERLRQVSEASRREFISEFDRAVAAARADWDAAQQQAAKQWNDQIETGKGLAARAAQDAAEAASHTIEDRSRARLQSAADEVLAASSLALNQAAADARGKFASELEIASADRVGRAREQIDGLAMDAANRSRTELERAAEMAAAAFGQLLQGASDRQIESFDSNAASIAQAHKDALETSARRLLRNFETSAESSLARFHQQMAARVETSIAEGRSVLLNEINGAVETFRAEREQRERDWMANLEQLNAQSAARYQERIDTASDSWVLSCVRRLNEHGQNLVESMMRSADDAVRESCAKLFDGLAEILRQRSALSQRQNHPAGQGSEAAAAPLPPEADQPSI